MVEMDSKRTLMHLIRTSNPVVVQNALMRASDREIAMATRYMVDEELQSVLSRVAKAKARRIEDERKLQEHLRIRNDQYERAVARVIDLLSGRKNPSASSYIRPRFARSRP